MPELPEVELAGRTIQKALAKTRIQRATSPVRHIFERGNRARVLRALTATRLLGLRRHGKVLLAQLERSEGLVCRLGMSGKWIHHSDGRGPSHVRLRLRLADGTQLLYRDPRMFGSVVAVDAADLDNQVLDLGPDPIHDGIDEDELADAFRATTRTIKAALMDQRVIAGLGNIQVTEVLWMAKVWPQWPADALRRPQIRRVRTAILESLHSTIDALTDTGAQYISEGADNRFQVYGREGEPCPRCARTLDKIKLDGRGTTYCPSCQRRRRT